MAEVQNLCRGRNRAEQSLREQVERGRRHGERHLLHHDAVAARALVPRVQHAAVVLVGRDDLVTRLQVDPELGDLERFTRVARDRKLLGVASECGRQPAPHRLDVGLEDLPHVVHGRLVRQVEVPLERLVHHARARAAPAVVQVDDRPVEREGLLNLPPVRFVCGQLHRAVPGTDPGCRREPGLGLVGEGGQRRGPGSAGPAKKRAARDHGAQRIQYWRGADSDH
jgi:hypothetical protein